MKQNEIWQGSALPALVNMAPARVHRKDVIW